MRWVTAAVAIPILIYAIAFGPLWFLVVIVCAFAVIGSQELFNILEPDTPLIVRTAVHITTLIFFASIYLGLIMLLPFVAMLWLFLPLSLMMFLKPIPSATFTAVLGRTWMAAAYPAVPLAMLLALRLRPRGALWVFFLLILIFATDTGAFYCGRSLGRHRLFEAVSPKKTWEGAIGGTCISIAASFGFVTLFPIVSPGLAVLMAFLVSAVGQVGDLAESMLKRCHGVKDSGGILPGHGGVLDRIDSLLFGAPVLYLFTAFM